MQECTLIGVPPLRYKHRVKEERVRDMPRPIIRVFDLHSELGKCVDFGNVCFSLDLEAVESLVVVIHIVLDHRKSASSCQDRKPSRLCLRFLPEFWMETM